MAKREHVGIFDKLQKKRVIKVNHAVQTKNAILAVLATVGGLLVNQLGGWDGTLAVLVGFMTADYITGMLVAAVFKRSGKSESGALSSRAGFTGLCKKCFILVFVWIGVMLDKLLAVEFTRQAVCLFYITNEGLSILENAGLMGFPYPPKIKAMLEALKEENKTTPPTV